MNVNKTDTRRNLWHKLLGKIFEELLTPVNVTVETGFPIIPTVQDGFWLSGERQAWSLAQ
jgi:hypothetical protein